MPIFLDRLDFFNFTAADNAQIHLEDLKFQQEFGCFVIAYWFDQNRKTTFRLIDAPNLEAIKRMYYHLHHSRPGKILQIKEGVIETFLGNIQNPEVPARKHNAQFFVSQEPILCAVMVMTLYVSASENYLRKERLFEDFKDCAQSIVKKNKGKTIKSSYDGCTYCFKSMSQSIKSALQIQHELSAQIKKTKQKKINLRIGIDGANPQELTLPSFADTTSLARRLCCIAGRNQIMVSSIVREELQIEDLGILVKKSNWKSLTYKDQRFLIRLMEVIELKYREDLKIEDFCRILGESRSQLYRKILQVTNLSLITLINEFRFKKAIELMHTQKDTNISQVAFETGFNSLSYFSRRFRKSYGILPSVYMNRRCVNPVELSELEQLC